MGNVWTWTEDDFNPLEGFAVSPLYTDFSTPCFDGLHTVIMGGSFISTGDEVSPPPAPASARPCARATGHIGIDGRGAGVVDKARAFARPRQGRGQASTST